MAKNVIATKADQIEDPLTREVLQYVMKELDRIKSMPPVTEDIKQIAVVINKLTRNL